MLVYSPELSPRFQYILEVIFKQLLGLNYQITNLKEEFQHHEGPKLNYSYQAIGDSAFIKASGLLYERQVNQQPQLRTSNKKWQELPILYPITEPALLPFDLFSASFYLLTRYEEYLPFDPDDHQRFHSGESLAFHENFLHRPVIDLWAMAFKKLLERQFPNQLIFSSPSYRFEPTIDIDNAWAYLNKGLFRSLGALLRPKQSMAERSYRFQVWRGKQPDPYDQYQMIKYLMEKHGLDPVLFLLVGPLGPYDRNTSPSNPAFKKLVASLARDFKLGIHPSYQSNSSAAQIEKEMAILARLSNQEITQSRHHFLKIHLPHTYRILHNIGIKHDYSMGYADRAGFRASIAQAYPFFDVESNSKTDLIVHPFQVMDLSLQAYMKLTPKSALSLIEQLIAETRAVGGTFSCLWHNESLSEWKHWTGWSVVFKEMLEMAK